MQKRKSKKTELLEDIDAWVARHQLVSNAYLDGLKNALSQNKNLPYWASLDPATSLPTKSEFLTKTAQRSFFYTQVLRNVLVFVPVALTWSAVSHASKAFGIFTTNNPNNVANFLQFWQNGYDVLPKEWTIGFIANLDFLLISLVILLTLVLSFLQKNLTLVNERGLQSFSFERDQLGYQISEFLFIKQRVTTVTVNAGINNSVQNLKSATETLRNVIEKINRKIEN